MMSLKKRKMNHWILMIAVLGFHLSAMGQAAESNGKTLFRTNCKACHSIDQRLVGPALKGVEERRTKDWIHKFVQGSQSMVLAGDSVALSLFNEYNKIPMPDQKLSVAEIDEVLAYVKAESNPAKIASNPIQRPEVVYASNSVPFQFSNYLFWIPFTVAIFFVIGALYYLTVLADINKSRS